MAIKSDILPTRSDLTGSQRALLEERVARARQAASKASSERSTIPLRAAGEEIPLSFAQERLWFLDQLEPRSAAYNVCQAVRMHGTLDVGALEKTLNAIIQRHEILRTNFVAPDGRPVQSIAPTRPLPLTVVDFGDGRNGAGEEAAQRRLHEESCRPFDLAQDMLIRALVIHVSPTEHTLLLTMHHIISDGWSIGILLRELAANYTAACSGENANLPELPIQYADYACWERQQLQGAALEKPLAYWRKQLAAPLPVLDLPVDHPRTVAPTSRGAAQMVMLPRPIAQGLKALSQAEGGTLFMTLLAAFQVLLHRWTGQEDIVVGSVVAGRRKVELERLIGFFVNTLVFRGDLTGNPTFRELLGRVREMSLGAFANQDLPFERLVQELRPDRTVSRNPLFQVMFVLQNAPMAPAELPRLTLEPLEVDTGTAKFDLTLSIIETAQGLRTALEYNADLFEAQTITRLLGCFQTLLESIVAEPDQAIAKLSLLTPDERNRLLTDFNATRRDYPRDRTIAQLFEEQVARTPDAVALTGGGQVLAYRELDQRAEVLAVRLREAFVGPDVIVGVCLERSIEAIVALVGILKAGGAYVSLDPTLPPERLAFMLEDTQARVLLTQACLRAKLPRHRATVVCVDEDVTRATCPRSDEQHGQVDRATSAATTPDNLAYVSYTSGSTGRPKGVAVPHRGVVRLVKNTDFMTFGPEDVFLQFAPIAFDASTLEIWGALLNGARLVVFPAGPASLAELGRVIEECGVTTLWLTAGLFHQMVEEQVDRLRNVRQLLAGGDVLSAAHVRHALEQLSRTQLINGYGPTENTTFTCCHRITAPPAPGRSVPIGRPIANTEVYILDAQLQPVPIGVPGELYAGGDGLARGYLNHADLTQEKFVAHPFSELWRGRPARDGKSTGETPAPRERLYRTGDLARWQADGSVEFLGRIDRQVKIRGFRVEPGEVESVLAALPIVKECAVVVRDDASGGKSLVAYVVAKQTPAPTSDIWRGLLADKLPDYLVPSAFVSLEHLPLTPNGKLDTAALPVSEGARPELQDAFVAPRDAVEQKLAEIWQQVLGVNAVGVHDRFFDLGGHSLLAVRMVAQVEKQLGKKLPVAAIFQHRTIEQLALLLRSNEAHAPATSIVEIQGKGTRPPLYLVHGVGGGMFWGYANLARHLGTDQPVYAFKSRGLDGLPEWPTIEEMAANYIADLRVHQPRGPWLLGGYCFGGIVAYEMARQLKAQGEDVALLALMNCSPPNTSYQRTAHWHSPAWLWRFARNIGYTLGCFLFEWSARERLEYVRWKFRLLRKKAAGPAAAPQNGTDLNVTDVDEMVNLAAYSEDQRRLWQTHVKALKDFQPQSYAGHVTLFRTRGHPLLCSFENHYGWTDLVGGGITQRITPGGHGSVLEEPYVQRVAAELTDCLKPIAPSGTQAT